MQGGVGGGGRVSTEGPGRPQKGENGKVHKAREYKAAPP